MRDLSYLKEKPIAVLGAGALGKALAADCTLAGNEVRLFDIPPFSETTLSYVKKTGIEIYGTQLNLYGFRRSGKAELSMVTDQIEKAVKGAGIVIVAVPSTGHESFFKLLIPCLEDGMTVHIIPDNFGSFIFRRMMREMNCNANVLVGGWVGPPFDARIDFEGNTPLPRVKLDYRALQGKGAALPYRDQEDFIESTKFIGAFESFHSGDGILPSDTIMDTCLSHMNPLLHTIGMVMGTSVMENFTPILGKHLEEFSIYTHAFCPSMAKVQHAFYLEQAAIAKAMGVGISHFVEEEFYSRESVIGMKYLGKSFRIGYDEINHAAMGTGPQSVNSRYLTEDVPTGCVMFHHLGRTFGVETPVIDSIITLASAMLKRNFMEEGYTLKTIGIEGFDKEALHRYLKEGVSA